MDIKQEQNKIDNLIETEKKILNAAYSELGKRICEIYLPEQFPDLANWFSPITNSKKKIENYEMERKKLEDRLCWNCRTPIPEGAKFCYFCGADLTQKVSADKCPNCGEKITAGAAFCSNCGQKLK